MVNFKTLSLTTVSTLFFISTPLYAEAPFGISMSTPVSQLSLGSQIDEGVYYLQNVPTPSPYFNEHIIMVSEQVGVCAVAATTPPISRSYSDVIPYLTYFVEDFSEKYGEIYLVTNLDTDTELTSENLPSIGKKVFGDQDLLAGFILDDSVLAAGNSAKS